MDGTTAGTGAGPRMIQPVVKNVILASSDQVAIDAVAAKLMGFEPLVIIPTLIGEIEQDTLYWPLKYRRVAARWRQDTAWGHLFQRYQREGYVGH
mgnify:CR=1 FL=1